jgi:glycosyltransferase 2 family protein
MAYNRRRVHETIRCLFTHEAFRVMKNRIALILKLLLSAGILAYILRTIPVSEIIKALSLASLPLVAVGLIFDPISMFVNAIYMKLLFGIQNTSLSIKKIIRISFITEFYGFFFPGSVSSGLIRWHQFSRASGKPAEVFAIIVFVRLWDTAVTFAIGSLFYLIDRTTKNQPLGILLASLSLLTWVILCIIFNHKISAYLQTRLKPNRLFPQSFVLKVKTLLHSVGKFDFRKSRIVIYTLITIPLRQFLSLLAFVFFAYSLRLDAHLISLGASYYMLSIVLMMPITFSGLGVREGSLIMLLSRYSIPSAKAVALSWLLFFNVFFLRFIGGILELIRLITWKFGKKPLASPKI